MRVEHVARRLESVMQAQSDVDAVAGEVERDLFQARSRARSSRERLAQEVRLAAAAIYGTVTVFESVVEAQKRIPAKSVHNVLYTTFSADTLARCVEVLADYRLDANSRRAA